MGISTQKFELLQGVLKVICRTSVVGTWNMDWMFRTLVSSLNIKQIKR